MVKNFHFAVVWEDKGKRCAYRLKMNEDTNILSRIDQMRASNNIEAIHICGTKTQAEGFVNSWNEAYRANGTYMFAYEPQS